MSPRPALDLTLRVAAAAADSRRGIVRAHPEVLAGLGLREWDAVEITGARVTGAVVAASPTDAPVGTLVVDEVVSANCGVGDDGTVSVRAAAVTGAATISVQGLPPAAFDLPEKTMRSALLGKVVRVGDAVTLLPRDLGPDFPTGETTRSLGALLGATWSTRLLTVTATDPDGVVSVQPTTAVVRSGQGSPSPGVTTATPTRPAGRTAVADVVFPTPATVPREELVGFGDRPEVLAQWLSLALDRTDILTRLGASPHLGVLVAGPSGVGKATLVRSVCDGRRVEELDGPSTGALEPAQRLEKVRAAAERTRENGGVLLVTDVDALLPATPDPASTLVLGRLRSVVAHDDCALVATCVRVDDVDDRLREPDLCDRVLQLGLPDAADREAILGHLLADVPACDLDLSAVAERTPAFVAGDLVALVRESALRAAGRVGDGPADDARIEQDDLLAAAGVIRPLARADVDELALGTVTLDDVGDMEEVRRALTEIVLWPLQHPESFDRLGVDPARGVLLYGPPGCGKTFVVRALAASGRLTVHMVKGAELMDKWVGSSEKAVRELFRRARDSAPSLVFLDEIDALAPRRGQSTDSGVGDRVVAALLTELDGAEPLSGVVVLGATNRPELIDPALLRPGRLERLVFVPPPDAAARAEILRAAGRGVPLADDVDLDALAADLDGYSAADCASLLREAALSAMRRDIDAATVTAGDVTTARRAVRPSLDAGQVAELEAYAQRRTE